MYVRPAERLADGRRRWMPAKCPVKIVYNVAFVQLLAAQPRHSNCPATARIVMICKDIDYAFIHNR